MQTHTHTRPALAALVLFAASAAQAGNYTVTTTADSGPGSLRQIITDLPAGEPNAILFQPGGSGIVVIAVASDLPALRGTSITIDGAYSLGGIAIDGLDTHRLIHTDGTPTTIRNITLRNGAGGISSGCIQATAPLLLDNIVVEGCRAGINSGNAYGGGLSGAGELTVRRSAFRDNLAQSGNGGGNQAGGGIYWSTGTVLIEDVLFEGNRVENGPNFFSDGGAANFFQSDVTVRRTRFIGNSVVAPTPGGNAGGGAVACRRGRCVFDSTYFGGNDSSIAGSAVSMLEGDLELRNVVVQDSLGGYGGAVRVAGFQSPATLTIDNSTFTDNANGSWSGYGVHLDVGGGLEPTTVLRIANTAFGAAEGGAACNARDAVGYAGPGYNRAVDATCDTLLGSDSALATPEQLGLGIPVFGGYVEVPQLSPQSVLIDAGNPAAPGSAAGSCLWYDANQRTRPRDGDGDGVQRCDIGAQEYIRPILFSDGFET